MNKPANAGESIVLEMYQDTHLKLIALDEEFAAYKVRARACEQDLIGTRLELRTTQRRLEQLLDKFLDS